MQVKALACELPATHEVPLSRWSTTDLAREACPSALVASISGSTLWRWLHQDAIRPWYHRSWIFPRDPNFADQAGRILDRYARRWEDKPLQDDEFVISADEKTSSQARRRKHPTRACRPRGTMQVEHQYFRGGAWTYLAGLDVHRARIFGRCETKNGIEPFDRLVEQVMTRPPYHDARRVFWIVDNCSAHPGTRAVQRLQRVSRAGPGPRAGSCQLVKSGGDLLLYRPTEGSYTQRLSRPGHSGRTAPRFPILLGIGGPALSMEVRSSRPERFAQQTQYPIGKN